MKGTTEEHLLTQGHLMPQGHDTEIKQTINICTK